MYLENWIMEALMNNSIGRRTFLKTGAATTIVAGSQTLVSFPAMADFAAGPTLRRNASTMAASDPILRGYRTAITRMRGLPDTNPCSWLYQAAIHGTFDPRNLQSWNTCHDDESFFWAWHRMYLHFFERIVRKYSGMYDWALPYWDWTNPGQLPLPAPFRDSGSVLFDHTRRATINGGSPLSTSLATSVSNAFTAVDYFNAQSGVNGPHGSVHIAVGGNMTAFETAAIDPIFWVHHSQVDRLWNLWLAQGGGRSSPVGNTAWKSLRYTFFDECCQPVTLTGCQVLRAANQLSYAYEGEPPQVNQYCPRSIFEIIRDLIIFVQLRRPFQLRRVPVKIPIPPPPPEMRERLTQVARSGGGLALRIGGVEAADQPGVSWEVHVGPRGFGPSERSLVGMFALFGTGLRTRGHHFRPAEFVFPIGKAVSGIDPSRLEVLFIPVSGLGGDRGQERAAVPRVPVTIGELSIIADLPAKLPPQDEQEKLRREEDMR
jgi:tyrosinase